MVEKSKTIEVSGLIFQSDMEQSSDHERPFSLLLAAGLFVVRSDEIAGGGA
jgi:hypothetical protein